ncbi:hypothetical protein B0H10DRAFT_2224999 [Mycena sp. CBHHK59/15]|nr:hypothetical protein B0H10DRAFT_2224999 [Mycena sp. CBHHK59/15]
MHTIHCSLNLATGFGAAAWSNTTSCYWECRRLGELVIRSAAKFNPEHDTCCDTHITYSAVNEHEVTDFHIVWTKTTTIAGVDCILTQVIGEDADLCPIWAFWNHLTVNDSPPPLTPLFAFGEHGTWPCASLLVCKTGLDVPDPSNANLDATTREPLDLDPDVNDQTRHIIPLRPMPSAKPDLDVNEHEDKDMNTDNDNTTMNTLPPAPTHAAPAAAAATQPTPAAAAAAGQQAPTTALGLGGTALLMALAPAPMLPTHAELMAFVPLDHADNPHLGTLPGQPVPTNNASGRAPYMRSNSHLTNRVITSQRTYTNIMLTQCDTIEVQCGEYLALTIYLGGQRFFACYKNALDHIYTAVASIASPVDMELFCPVPIEAQTNDWSKKYMDPFTVFAHFHDPSIRTQIYNQRVFAVSRDLAWYVDTINPNRRS